MRRAARLTLLLALLAACDRKAAPTVPEAPVGTPPPVPASRAHTVVFLGDSLTAGYGVDRDAAFPALLAARLQAAGRPWKLVDAGVSGDTTAGGVTRLDWVFRSKPDVLVVALGANDGLRGLPVDASERNLRAILERARTEGCAVLLVGMQMPENLGPAYRARFAAVYPKLAKEFGVPLLPFLLEGVAMDLALNQADGIHPTAEGHRRVAETVWKALDPVLRRVEDRKR
ncbi:MAG: arylesterase [Holophagaceae bacterium]